MTPQELIDQHIIKRLLLTPENMIDYPLTPDYKATCTPRFYVEYDRDVEEYYWDERDEIPMDSEERDWFPTAEEAWISCAKENQIEPAYFCPMEDVVVTQWLHERLAKKGQPVQQYKSLYVWGRPTSREATQDDSVIIAIAKENTAK